jgi:hypothetical protein
MDEYEIEIRAVDRRIAALKMAPDGGDPILLAELEHESHVLKTVYALALSLEERGAADPWVREGLAQLAFAPWGLKAAYDFIYDLVEELPVPDSRRTGDLLRSIRELDPVAELRTRLAEREVS